MSDRVEDWEDDGHVCQECVNKDAEIERLTDELINVEQVAKDRYCEMQTEIERLRAHRDALQDECDEWADTCDKLQAVVDAVKHLLAGGDKEALYYLEQALATLETNDE